MRAPTPEVMLSALVAVTLALVGCARPVESGEERIVADGLGGAAGGSTASPDGGGAGDSSSLDGVKDGQEVCDGFDNDADGEIDEGINGTECALPSDAGVGTQRCESGRLQCVTCTPGETRTGSCGCNQTRNDICESDGTWRLGTCDGCTAPKTHCEACIPGEKIVRRCDGCPEGVDCGATCVGSVWECSKECEWKQIESCKPMTPTCSGDMAVIESCGTCGKRRKTCDGCFWNGDLCMDQGECKPGETRQTACYEKGCAEGLYTMQSCTAQCQWTKPSTCMGCKPGVTTQVNDCVRGAPQCGQSKVEITCELRSSLPICGGAQSLPVGQVTNYKTVQQCRPGMCTPGQSYPQQCTTASGATGTQKVSCGSDCTWAPPSECTPGGSTCPTGSSCTPAEKTTAEKSCGNNTCGKTYTETKTCMASGCGFSVQTTQATSCPECAVGQTKQIYCKTSAGQCGTVTVKCDSTCNWGSEPASGATLAECQPSPGSCVPGAEKTDYVSCGGDTCGRTYPRKYKCMSTGCGFQFVSEDKSVCPTCKPGATETTAELCKAGFPSCGQVQRKCNADTCQWQTLPCAVCG